MNIGFTGTRTGMTAAQWLTFKDLYDGLAWWSSTPITFLHGGAIGADQQAASYVAELDRDRLECFPAIGTTYRPVYKETIHPMMDPLDRNRMIVNQSTILIATPGQAVDQVRSGTWRTVRYARRLRLPIAVIQPDGFVAWERREALTPQLSIQFEEPEHGST